MRIVVNVETGGITNLPDLDPLPPITKAQLASNLLIEYRQDTEFLQQSWVSAMCSQEDPETIAGILSEIQDRKSQYLQDLQVIKTS